MPRAALILWPMFPVPPRRVGGTSTQFQVHVEHLDLTKSVLMSASWSILGLIPAPLAGAAQKRLFDANGAGLSSVACLTEQL